MIEQLPIEDAYPNARNAVAAFEAADGANEYWAEARKIICRPQHLLEINIVRAEDREDSWADEMKTTDFRRYVAAKLGMF